ncbi:hypothetical protein Tco_0011416 [Tanacetum coccineum]
MSFSKRSNTAQVCYTKPLESLKRKNDSFFWVDSSAFPLSITWHNNKTLKKDPHPTPTEFNAEVCDFLATYPSPFWKFSESFLCLVGISHYYELDENVYLVFLTDDDEEMDLFSFINHADPTKVRIGEREVRKGEVSLLESTRGRVILLASVNEQGNKNDDVQDVGVHVVNEEGVVDDPENPSVRGGGATNSITGPNLRSQRPTERFVISSDSSHHSSTNAANVEVSSIVRSPVPNPPIMTTVVADTSSIPVPRLSTDSFYVSQDMDSETLHQTYVPKWNVTNDFALDDPDVCRSVINHLAPPVLFSQLRIMDYDQLLVKFNAGAARQTCLSSKVSLRLEHDLRDKKKLVGKRAMQTGLLKERDVKIVATVEATKAARASELDGLGEQNLALEMNAQVAKLNDDLSILRLSFGELSAKAATLESQKDSLTDQDEQVKVLSGRVAKLDSELMTEYLAVLGEAIRCIINKGMQDGLVAGIDHGKARRGLVDIVSYNPSVEANYVFAVNALLTMDLPLFARLES